MLTLRAQPGESLSLDEMKRRLPAIFSPRPVAGMGRYYQFISTADVLKRLMDEGFLPVEGRTTGAPSSRYYAKHMIRLRGASDLARPDNQFGAAGVAYEIILRNAHDGSSAYRLYAGLIKFECENGLVVGDGTVQAIRLAHRVVSTERREHFRERLLNKVVASAQAILGQGPAVAEKIGLWQETMLEPEERLALAKAAHRVRFKPTSKIKPEQLLVPRRASEQGQRSVWAVGNIIQENLMQGGIMPDVEGDVRKRTPRKYQPSRPIQAIGRDIAINCTVWALMDKAAEEASRRAKVWSPPRPPALEVFQSKESEA
jgi:Domain of unknown function (DUF932)